MWVQEDSTKRKHWQRGQSFTAETHQNVRPVVVCPWQLRVPTQAFKYLWFHAAYSIKSLKGVKSILLENEIYQAP